MSGLQVTEMTRRAEETGNVLAQEKPTKPLKRGSPMLAVVQATKYCLLLETNSVWKTDDVFLGVKIAKKEVGLISTTRTAILTVSGQSVSTRPSVSNT